MKKQEDDLHVKTVLEYLVMINRQSYSGIGRELNITPQQFSDWIKKRRPVPQERLKALAAYFGVPEAVLVDSQLFANTLTPAAKIDLQLLLLDQKIAGLESEGADAQDIAPYQEKKRQLQQERLNQVRLTRMAALLERGEARAAEVIDLVLDELEAGHSVELHTKLQEGRRKP